MMVPVTTNGEGDDVDKESSPPPDIVENIVPSASPAADDNEPLSVEAWLDEFERQSSEKGFEHKLRRFARFHARRVALARRTLDEDYVSALVQDAVDDVLDRKLKWDPRRVSLTSYLYRVLESRARHDYVRALKHVRFDPTARASEVSEEVEAALGRETLPEAVRAEAAEITDRVLAQLRLLASGDADVLALLDAYVQLASKRVDVLAVTDLSDKRYDAARRRLHRLVKMLPPDLVDAARSFT
jgi:hypothetical protein